MNAQAIGDSLSVVKDPFNISSMCKFSIYCSPKWSGQGWNYSGTVGFKNGNTEGEQKFNAKSLHELLVKMESFVKELEDKK